MRSPDDPSRPDGSTPRAPFIASPHRQIERGDYGSGSYGDFEPGPLVPASGARSPTGLDRDRLSARGEQGYGRPYGGHRGRGPRGYRRADERVLDEVCARLSEDDEVDATEIVVHVEDGEVTLTGSVETRSQKRRAEEVIDSVLGVSQVSNRLRVVPTAVIPS